MEKTVKTARQMVEEAGIGVVSVGPDEPVMAVLQAMADRNVNGVLVIDNGQLVGIVTERDYALKVELRGRTARDTRAREIMNRLLRTGYWAAFGYIAAEADVARERGEG